MGCKQTCRQVSDCFLVGWGRGVGVPRWQGRHGSNTTAGKRRIRMREWLGSLSLNVAGLEEEGAWDYVGGQWGMTHAQMILDRVHRWERLTRVTCELLWHFPHWLCGWEAGRIGHKWLAGHMTWHAATVINTIRTLKGLWISLVNKLVVTFT